MPHVQVTWLVVTEVRNKSFGLVRECRHDILVLCFAYCPSCFVWSVIFFIVECGIAHFLHTCALCVYSMFGHHPLGYLCAKFCSCRAPRPVAELARGEKWCTQSLTQSLTQLMWYAGNRSFRFVITCTQSVVPRSRSIC